MTIVDMGNYKPKLTPTNKPPLQFKDKKGDAFIAREVQLENGVKCFAVANAKQPDKALIMNHDTFAKHLQENLPNITKRHAGDTFTKS